MELNEQARLFQFRFIVTWLCYLSFFRGSLSFFTGYVIAVIPIYLALLIIIIPPLAVLLPYVDYNKGFIIMVSCWFGGVLLNLIGLKLIFILIGTSATFMVMRIDFVNYDSRSNNLLVGVLIVDFLIRSPNYGQDLFVNSNFFSKFVATVSIILVISSLYSSKNDFESPDKKPKRLEDQSQSQLFFVILVFIIMAIYSVEFAGPGLFVLNGNSGLPLSIIGSTIMFVLSGFLAIRLSSRINHKVGALLGIILGGSIYFYPWYGITLILWGIGIFCLQSIGLYVIHNLIGFGSRQINRFILLGHYIVVFVMYLGLITESYFLIPVLSMLVGIVIYVIPTTHNLPKWQIKIQLKNMKNKLVFIMFILLFVSPLIPYQSQNEKLSQTSEIVLMTYNLHFGISGNGEDNTNEVIKQIKSVNPTVIAFQEVTIIAAINGYKDMYSILKYELEPLGYKFSYFSEGGKYQTRNVVFSKFEIQSATTHDISPRVVYERNVIEVKLKLGDTQILIYGTHLTHVEEKKSNPDRVTQAQNLMEIIDIETIDIPVFLLGDFNSEPQWEETTVITSEMFDSWEQSRGFDDGFTWPHDSPRQRIDYIFHNNQTTLLECQIINTSASDHLPVICSFDIPNGN